MTTPTTLWHYTSLDTLDKMLGPRRPAVTQMTLRLSHADFLNDPLERRLVYSEYRRRVEELEAKSPGVSGAWDTDEEVQFNLAPFMLSLSRDDDNLLLWQSYADRMRGVAIGFDSAALLNTARDSGSQRGFSISQVDYGTAEIGVLVDKVIANMASIVDYPREALQGAPNKALDFAADSAYTDLAQQASQFKTAGWRQEDEWRLVAKLSVPVTSARNDSADVEAIRSDWQWAGTSPRPFLELKVDPWVVLTDVVSGPLGSSNAVRSILAAHGLTTPVRQSPTVYRER